VKLIKQPSELPYIRKASEIADAAMIAVRDALKPGVTEKEIAGLAQYEMAKLGGEEPAIRTIVRTGPRTAAHHALPSMRKIQANEMIGVDFCAVFNRYHVDLSRCFYIGKPDPRWTDLFDKIAGSIEVVKQELKPGDPMSRLHAIANEYIDKAELRRYVWWIDGYDLGISTPPDWVGHTFLGGGRFEEANYDVGVVTNYENVIDVTEDNWPGGRGGNYIETLLMTENGIEIMSKLDRRLTVL
jgi:Xaa-Pro aminopeptidase